MARFLDLLAFWRSNRPTRKNQSKRPFPTTQPPTSHPHDSAPTQQLPRLDGAAVQSATFLVPDLGDIRPFVQGARPVSMSDLLVAISKNEPSCVPSKAPLNPPLQVKLDRPAPSSEWSLRGNPKRKLEDRADEDGLGSLDNGYGSFTSLPDRSYRLDFEARQHAESVQATQVSFQPAPLKKPRLVSLHPTASATSLQAALCDAPTSVETHPGLSPRPSQMFGQPELIGRLPAEVWYRIFMHNELSSLQALLPDPLANHGLDSPARPPKGSLAVKLSAALEAQQRRHDLARLCRRLGPLARHAAWSTIVLGSTRMVERVARKFEAESELAGHVQTCILDLSPSPTPTPPTGPPFESPKSIRKSIPQYTSPGQSPSTPRISDSRLPRWKPSPSHTPKPSARPPPTLHRQVLTHSKPAQNKKPEVFQSVLIPSLPLSKHAETDRNTKLNAARPPPPTDREDESLAVPGGLEEAVWTASLPSLFLSIARSLRVCCVMGEERVATRALKSLSVLASLLGGLAELYVEGGGETGDVFALVDGLRALVGRKGGVALRMVAVSGPRSTLVGRPSSSPLVVPCLDAPRRPSAGSLLARSTSSATSSAPPPQPHIALTHLVLGPGLPLTAEELSWLVACATAPAPGRGLQTLVVSLRASPERANLGASVSSTSSGTSMHTRRTLSCRAALGRTFERIGPSLVRLGIEEDWQAPLSGSLSRKVKFTDPNEDSRDDEDSDGGLLDEAVAFCGKLEGLSLPCSANGQLYSTTLLNVLPFTLRVLEVVDVGMTTTRMGSALGSEVEEDESKKEFRGGGGVIGPESIWKARSQAALFGLEKIRIKNFNQNLGAATGGCGGGVGRKGKTVWSCGSGGVEKLERVGIVVERCGV